MHAIVGLGNPGKRYERTRHNVGFLVVDQLAKRHAPFDSFQKRFKAQVLKCQMGQESQKEAAILCKPETFMNLSGESVGPLRGYYRVEPENIVVIHDDLDLPFGRLRIKKGGGHGGHNGLKSLEQHLKTRDFIRVRVGISRPRGEQSVSDYVLQKFSSDEEEALPEILNRASEAVENLITKDLKSTMNQFNADPSKGKAAPKESE